MVELFNGTRLEGMPMRMLTGGAFDWAAVSLAGFIGLRTSLYL